MMVLVNTDTPPRGEIVVAAGPREAERRVLAWVEARRARAPGELWPPLRIVVPSWSLQRHLVAVLVRELGATAGVVVQTHRALAREVVEAAGEPLPEGGSVLQDLLVRQLATAEPTLARTLGDLDDGYAPVAAAVRDLVDAGLDEASFEPALEALGEASLGPASRERCRAVLRVAMGVLEAHDERGLAHRGTLLRRAAELLEERSHVLPAGGILIHGFAEATGLVSGLLDALVGREGAELLLDHPPDPARPGEPDAGIDFVCRLADRLGGPGVAAALPWPAAPTPAILEPFVAPGPEAEVREVAARIRRLLDGGTPPESIGVVIRSLDSTLAGALRRHFGRLGIPFSGEGVTLPAGAISRRVEATLEILGRQDGAGIDSWLEAVAGLAGVEDLQLLELALRSVGVFRLAQLGGFEPARVCRGGWLRLAVVEGVEERAGVERRRHRRFPRAELEAAREAGGRLVRLLRSRPKDGEVRELFSWVDEVLALLGWTRREAPKDPLVSALAALQAELPDDLHTAWRDMEPILSRRWRSAGTVPLEGAGGGVQVLTAMEARGRTFEHLFLMSLNRGLFPRRSHEDPVLPEPARAVLSVVLPEMPMAGRRRLEERYLFAQMIAAADTVTLSWQSVDAEGRPRNPSAFIERLRLEGRLPRSPDPVSDVFGERPDGSIRPPLEHATALGLAGVRRGLAVAAEVLGDRRADHLQPLLDELDPPRARADLGPFLGVTGTGPPAEPWVTRLEAFSACPWRQFLERELGLAPPAEAMLAGTSLRGVLAGAVVHRVLERIVREAGAPSGPETELAQLAERQPVDVCWPAPEGVAALAEEEARGVAAEEGVPALGRALAQLAVPYLERAAELDWPTGRRLVLGAEIRGACSLAPRGAREISVSFRADRVDPGEGGALILTDYKAGKNDGPALPTALLRGQRLQAAAYACAAGEGGRGRYLFLDRASKCPEASLGWAETGELAGVIDLLLSAWREGILIPRWETPSGGEGPACRFCQVREACFRDDSTFRARMARAMETLEAGAPDGPIVGLWRLPARKPARKGKSS